MHEIVSILILGSFKYIVNFAGYFHFEKRLGLFFYFGRIEKQFYELQMFTIIFEEKLIKILAKNIRGVVLIKNNYVSI